VQYITVLIGFHRNFSRQYRFTIFIYWIHVKQELMCIYKHINCTGYL